MTRKTLIALIPMFLAALAISATPADAHRGSYGRYVRCKAILADKHLPTDAFEAALAECRINPDYFNPTTLRYDPEYVAR